MANRYLLGFDVGSSSVKASLVDADTGKCAASAFFPEKEAPITAVKNGWAEQDPQSWWNYAKLSLARRGHATMLAAIRYPAEKNEFCRRRECR